MPDNIIDLDAIVGEVEQREVRINGKSYFATPDPPVGLLYDMYKIGAKIDASHGEIADEDADEIMAVIQRVLGGIFGDDSGAEIFANVGMQKVLVLLGLMMEAYEAAGKVPGSSRASRRAGVNSKPTSNANTKSTSAKRASVNNGSVAAVSRT